MKPNNEKGNALLLTLLVLILLSVLSVSLLRISANTLKVSQNERSNQSLYYIAEAGVVEKYSEIKHLITPTYNTINQIYNAKTNKEKQSFNFSKEFFNRLETQFDFYSKKEDFEKMTDGKPIADVRVESKKIDENTKSYTITSVASVNNEKNSKRTVSKSFIISIDGKEEKGGEITIPNGVGIFAYSNINITNGQVIGDIIETSGSCKKINISGNPTINGSIYVPDSCTKDILSAPDWWIENNSPKIVHCTDEFVFPMPDFPTFPTFTTMSNINVNGHKVVDNGNIKITDYRVEDYILSLDKNYTFKNIEFDGNRKLTLDIGDRNISIVVDNITGNGHLDVKGTGTLTIYLKNNINLKGHFNSSASKVTMYVDSSGVSKTIKSSDYADFIANIYAKDANIELVGSGKIYGNVVTGGKSVKLSGATSATAKGYVVYAPNASVELTGSGTLNGTVISNTFTISDGATINTNTNYDMIDFPIFSGGIGSTGSNKVFETPIIKSTPIEEK